MDTHHSNSKLRRFEDAMKAVYGPFEGLTPGTSISHHRTEDLPIFSNPTTLAPPFSPTYILFSERKLGNWKGPHLILTMAKRPKQSARPHGTRPPAPAPAATGAATSGRTRSAS